MHGVLCDLCRKRPATLHLLQPAPGGCAELHICKTCQAERGLDLAQDPQPVADIVQGQAVPAAPAEGADSADELLSDAAEDQVTGAVVGVGVLLFGVVLGWLLERLRPVRKPEPH